MKKNKKNIKLDIEEEIMNDVSKNWNELFEKEGGPEDLGFKKVIDEMLKDGWKKSLPKTGLNGLISSYASLKSEQEKPTPLTRSVLIEKIDNSVGQWVYNNFMESINVDMDKIMKDSILILALTSTFKNVNLDLSCDNEESSD